MRDYYTRYPRPVLWLVPEGEIGDGRRRVAVAPFYLSTLPVTNRQMEAFEPRFRRSPLSPEDDDPAIGVELAQARAYCAWYGELARKPIRLPTATEWRHACRAGQPEGRSWGVAADADAWLWHAGNCAPERVPPLAAKRANAFGLYAMLGGVWEWAEGEDGGVLCGGSWRTSLAGIGCAAGEAPAAERVTEAGFRIARSLRPGGER